MNQGQERFFNFILERVKDDKVEEAKALLADNFRKQAEGTFTNEDIMQSITKITALLKPEKVEEVKAVMKQFGESSGQS